jgi:hypothetical protein
MVTETTSANTETLKEIDFSRNKESLVLVSSCCPLGFLETEPR